MGGGREMNLLSLCQHKKIQKYVEQNSSFQSPALLSFKSFEHPDITYKLREMKQL